jgi:tetratricopeptide (TPR) repeat protein
MFAAVSIPPTPEAASAVEPVATWTIVGIVVLLNASALFIIWWIVLSRYYRFALAILAMTCIGSLPSVLAYFDVVDVAQGAILINSPPASLGASAVFAMCFALLLDYLSTHKTLRRLVLIDSRRRAGRDYIKAGATVINNDPRLIERLVDETLKRKEAESQNKVLEAKSRLDEETISSLREQLTAAVSRTAASADEGKREAQEAFDSVQQTGDLSQVLAFLQAEALRAAALHATISAQIALYFEIAAVAYFQGDMEVAIEAFKAILDMVPDVNATKCLAMIYLTQYRLDEAEKLYRQLLDVDSKSIKAFAFSALGQIAFLRENRDLAEEHFRNARHIYLHINDTLRAARQDAHLAIVQANRSNLDAAESLLLSALAPIRAHGDSRELASVLNDLASVMVEQGNFAEAERFSLEALELDRRLRNYRGVAHALGVLAHVELERQNFDEAERLCREALAIHQHFQSRTGQVMRYYALGEIEFARAKSTDPSIGHALLAGYYLSKSFELAQPTQHRGGTEKVRRLLHGVGTVSVKSAESRFDSARFNEARALAYNALAIFRLLKDKPSCIRALQILTRILNAMHDEPTNGEVQARLHELSQLQNESVD